MYCATQNGHISIAPASNKVYIALYFINVMFIVTNPACKLQYH